MSSRKVRYLGDLVDILSGFAFDSQYFTDSGSVPIVRIRDVIPGRSSTFYSGEYDSKFIIRNGDIIIGMDGEFNRSRWRGGDALLNQRVCRIAASSTDLDDGYLFHFLPTALQAIEDVTPYVTVKHLSVKAIREIEITLPCLTDQRRIAATLDQAEALRAKRRSALAQLEALTHAFFLELFGHPVSNTKRLPLIPVGQLGDWKSGGTPPRGREEYFEGSIPWFSSGELNQMVVSESNEHISELALRETSAKAVP